MRKSDWLVQDKLFRISQTALPNGRIDFGIDITTSACYNRAASESGKHTIVIAISYRREDSTGITGRVYDRLQAEFGKANVFMDFDSIPYGVDFREHIAKTLDRSKVVLVIIGPEWVGQKSRKVRRIDDQADFVRIEVAGALQRRIPIIPVLINNAKMPTAEALPKEIAELAFRNGLVLDSGIDFHHHTDRLIAGIRAATGQVGEKSLKPPGDPDVVRRRKRIFAVAAACTFLAAIIVAVISLIVVRATKTPDSSSSAPLDFTSTASPSQPASRGEPTNDAILQVNGDSHGQTLEFIDVQGEHHTVSAPGKILNLPAGYGTMIVGPGVKTESVWIKAHVVSSWTYNPPPPTTPTASASRPPLMARSMPAQAAPPNGKLFAGTWRGSVHEDVRDASGKIVESTDSPAEVVIDDTQTKWKGLTGGSAFSRNRTLSYNGIITTGGSKQQLHATLIVQDDGASATYTKSLKPVGGGWPQRFAKGTLRKVQ